MSVIREGTPRIKLTSIVCFSFHQGKPAVPDQPGGADPVVIPEKVGKQHQQIFSASRRGRLPFFFSLHDLRPLSTLLLHFEHLPGGGGVPPGSCTRSISAIQLNFPFPQAIPSFLFSSLHDRNFSIRWREQKTGGYPNGEII